MTNEEEERYISRSAEVRKLKSGLTKLENRYPNDNIVQQLRAQIRLVYKQLMHSVEEEVKENTTMNFIKSYISPRAK